MAGLPSVVVMVNLSVCRSAVATYGFSVDTIISYYQEWVVEPFYVVVVGFNKLKCDYEYRAFRSAKRGDSKYSFKVRERFDALKHAVDKGVEWFNWRETDRVKISSPCIYITLTYDRSHDLEDSWLEVGRDFNRYISRLRRKYGKIHVVRAFESHKDGYCHVHAVLLFDSVMWRGFRHTGANGFVTFRVDAVEDFRAGWHGGFVDAQLCNSMKGAFNYVKKYVVKACDNSLGDLKGKKTLALSWFFQKRSFSLSGDLAKTYSDLIEEQYANSNRFHP